MRQSLHTVVRVRSILALIALAATGFSSGAVAAPPKPARPVSELMISADGGKPIYARNADAVRAPASLTKLMTLYLVFDALDGGKLKLNERIAISRHAANQEPSRLGLTPRTTLPLKTAMRAVAVDSANDAAVALAERLGGSELAFAKQMTRKAHALSMSRTSFANATGLTNRNNRSTARDIATLSLALLRNHPTYYSYFSARSLKWANRTLPNHNHLLGHIPGVDGIKTGYTADAGYNLAASAKRHGRRVIAVVMGERSAATRDVRVANLLERGFLPAVGLTSSGASAGRLR